MVVPKVNSPESALILLFNISKKVVNANEFLEIKAILSPLLTVIVRSLNKLFPSIDFDKSLIERI